jgi:hypothetical protein
VSGRHPAADLRSSLPSLTAGGVPNLPTVLTEVKPLPQGTFKPTLAYPDRVTRTKTEQPSGVTATVFHDVGKLKDVGPLWRGLAGAAVLMLLAAHLREFVARVELD